jgi:hypothetical protein
MSEETKGWTFTADDGGTYAVEKFTDQMKLAFNLLLELTKEMLVEQKEEEGEEEFPGFAS